MTVGEICTRQVQSIGPDALLVDAAHRMREFHVGALVVVEDRDGMLVPLGILTDRDIVVSVTAQGPERIQSLLVGDVVLPRLLTAQRTDSIFEALKQMRLHGVRRLPILDQDGSLFGILTLDDILAHLAEELGDAVKLIAREQQYERAGRTTT